MAPAGALRAPGAQPTNVHPNFQGTKLGFKVLIVKCNAFAKSIGKVNAFFFRLDLLMLDIVKYNVFFPLKSRHFFVLQRAPAGALGPWGPTPQP